jgi:hypothetical protein
MKKFTYFQTEKQKAKTRFIFQNLGAESVPSEAEKKSTPTEKFDQLEEGSTRARLSLMKEFGEQFSPTLLKINDILTAQRLNSNEEYEGKVIELPLPAVEGKKIYSLRETDTLTKTPILKIFHGDPAQNGKQILDLPTWLKEKGIQ